MMVLLALLGGGFWGPGPSNATAEPPLPLTLTLEFRGFEAAAPELPEADSLWRVLWLLELEPSPNETPSEFRWPEFAIRTDGDRLSVPVGEKWEPYFVSRLELGTGKMRQLDAEPRFFPMMSRLILGLPMGLIEALTTAVIPDHVIVNGKQVLDQVSAEEDLATIAGRTLIMAELKFFASLPTSHINKLGAQMGTEELDSKRFNRLHWRALSTAMKNGYRERYDIPALDLDTILGAISTGDWIDFVIIPAAVSIYATRFGIDRKIRISDDVRMELHIEKLSRFQSVIQDNHGGRLFSASLNLFKLPVSAIVSLNAAPNGVGIGFIGIGTDVNTALRALYSYEEPRDR